MEWGGGEAAEEKQLKLKVQEGKRRKLLKTRGKSGMGNHLFDVHWGKNFSQSWGMWNGRNEQ